jgi:hypothetical protein
MSWSAGGLAFDDHQVRVPILYLSLTLRPSFRLSNPLKAQTSRELAQVCQQRAGAPTSWASRSTAPVALRAQPTALRAHTSLTAKLSTSLRAGRYLGVRC